MLGGVSRSGPRWHSSDARLRVMSSADSLPDPELLSRWSALTGLIASAEEMLGRRGGAWTALALVAADTASEAFLGFIATAGSTPLGDREGWDKIYDLALAAFAENGRDLLQASGRESIVHTGFGISPCTLAPSRFPAKQRPLSRQPGT